MPSARVYGQSERAGRRDLGRLLAPGSIAVVGGGAWCRQVVRQAREMGFQGAIYRVHPDPTPVEGIGAVADIDALPEVPDAVFLGINRNATIEAVRRLSEMGAGGAVCFASGFSEARAEDAGSTDLQQALVDAAGDMPILGPNCYGFINALDGALLWPDQHGCRPVARGVAILTQSSNIAINLTMQQRGLPVAITVACGNMAQITQAALALALLDDPRITAIGLHIEGMHDTAEWHAVALKAFERNVPVVVLKVGASTEAQAATISHTASLSGSDAGARALLRRLGFAQVGDLPCFLSALMIAHGAGPVASSAIASISCSGGEASLVADMAMARGLRFPPLLGAQKAALAQALGPMVALSNPLDYHTYIWGDAEKMAAAWLPMASDQISMLLIVLDYPHTDASDWVSATQAAIEVRRQSKRPVAVVSTLPELLPQEIADELRRAAVIPLHGLHEALSALGALAECEPPLRRPPLPPQPVVPGRIISEVEGKAMLRAHGVQVPLGVTVGRSDPIETYAAELASPMVLKSLGVAHKSDVGGVRLRLTHSDLEDARRQMPGAQFLLEEMVEGAVAELLIGIVRDPAHGFVLTLAAGGVMTELWRDQQSLLLPVSRPEVDAALDRLRIAPLLAGYRGAAGADRAAIWQAIDALQRCVVAQADEICEIEINPLICTRDGAWAVDALVMLADKHDETKEPDA